MEEQTVETPALIAKGDDGDIYVCLPIGPEIRKLTERGFETLELNIDLELEIEDIKEIIEEGDIASLIVPPKDYTET